MLFSLLDLHLSSKWQKDALFICLICICQVNGRKMLFSLLDLHLSSKWQKDALFIAWSAFVNLMAERCSFHCLICICQLNGRKMLIAWSAFVKSSAQISLTFLAILLYCPLFPAGLQGNILYQHRAVVCRFLLVVLPLLVHVKGSTGVCHLWVHLYFSCSVPYVWFVYLG